MAGARRGWGRHAVPGRGVGPLVPWLLAAKRQAVDGGTAAAQAYRDDAAFTDLALA